MRWQILSMEWGSVATSRAQLPAALSHFVLPDLGDDIVSPSQRTMFYDTVPRSSQIQTLAVNNRSNDEWLNYVRQRQLEGRETSEDSNPGSPLLLVVGGNEKTAGNVGLSTVKAIRSILQNGGDDTMVWAVVDPNDPRSVNSLETKLEAGATGIITQPLLSSQAFDSLNAYTTLLSNSPGTSLVAGMALPKTLRGLLFWESLLKSNLSSDSLFQDHCRYFGSGGDPCQWALSQQQALEDISLLTGVHYMPLKNNKAVMSLLSTLGKH